MYSQKDKQKRGASFEREFRESANHIQCWVYKLSASFAGTPFDYLLLTGGGNYAVELKRIMEDRLPYSLIRDNQRAGLTRFEALPRNRSIIICNIKSDTENLAYIIPWKEVRDDVCSGRSGSINPRQYIPVPRIAVKGRMLWDLKLLVG